MDYKTCKMDDIINYCVKHDEVEWLKETCAMTFSTDKNRKGTRKITAMEVKQAFFQKYMPEKMPKAKPKKPSFYERVAAL